MLMVYPWHLLQVCYFDHPPQNLQKLKFHFQTRISTGRMSGESFEWWNIHTLCGIDSYNWNIGVFMQPDLPTWIIQTLRDSSKLEYLGRLLAGQFNIFPTSQNLHVLQFVVLSNISLSLFIPVSLSFKTYLLKRRFNTLTSSSVQAVSPYSKWIWSFLVNFIIFNGRIVQSIIHNFKVLPFQLTRRHKCTRLLLHL